MGVKLRAREGRDYLGGGEGSKKSPKKTSATDRPPPFHIFSYEFNYDYSANKLYIQDGTGVAPKLVDLKDISTPPPPGGGP